MGGEAPFPPMIQRSFYENIKASSDTDKEQRTNEL